MTRYNCYLKYSYKKIKQLSNSSLRFDMWWVDLFIKLSKDLCFARIQI